LRRIIEGKTGRPLGEIVRELYRDRSQSAAQVACLCARLAGQEVTVGVVEEWLDEFSLAGGEERWAAMVPRLKTLLEKLIAEEADRRGRKRSVYDG